MKRIVPIILMLLILMPTAACCADISLLMPGSGNNLEAGKNSAIAWTYSGYPDTSTVRISLLKDGSEVGEIANNVPIRYSGSPSGNGALPNMWKTGTLSKGTAAPACGFKVRVQVNNAPAIAESAKPFCIIAAGTGPSLKLVSPNGGETLRVGDSFKIAWNFTGPDTPLRIRLIQGSGYDKGLLANTSTGLKSFDWKVGTILPPFDKQYIAAGHDYRIRIETATGGFRDESDKAFTITRPVALGDKAVSNPGLMKKATASVGPKSIQITAPAPGTTYQRTGEFRINYTFSGNLKDSHIKILLMKAGAPESAAFVLAEKKYINSGTFFCYVPTREFLEEGSYRIRVQSLDYPGTFAESGAIKIVPKVESVSTVFTAKTSNHFKYLQKAANGKTSVAYDPQGLGHPDPGPGCARIGFANRCKDGNQKSLLYRSLISFDLRSLKGKVKWARLSFVKNDGTPDAAKTLYSLDVPWNGSGSDLFAVPGTVADPNKLGNIVQQWIDDPKMNFGLLMAGPNEAMSCNNLGHVMMLGNVQLSIGIDAIY